MLRHLLSEECVQFISECHSLEQCLRAVIGELPEWRFTERHRKGLYESALNHQESTWRFISHGVLFMPIPYSGVRYPVLSIAACREKVKDLRRGEVIAICLLVMPEQDSEFILSETEMSLQQLFQGRFLQERMRISQDRSELYSILARYQMDAGLRVAV